jgi:hypothetical protein
MELSGHPASRILHRPARPLPASVTAIAVQPRPAIVAAERAVFAALAPIQAAAARRQTSAVSQPEFRAAMEAFAAPKSA